MPFGRFVRDSSSRLQGRGGGNRVTLGALRPPPPPTAGLPSKGAKLVGCAEAVARMHEVDFKIERDPADAWPDFVGWRVNYERAAYAVAFAVDAVPALWSGPRYHGIPPIPTIRPGRGRPSK